MLKMFKTNYPPKYTVSAIVSAYNSERFIKERLQNLLDQSLYRKNQLEIIVVDSGSQQAEGQVVREFMGQSDHIVYVRTPVRESVYGAWNRGIRLANGKYVINANADDRFASDGLVQMADALSTHCDVHAVFGDWLQTGLENDGLDSDTKKALLNYPEFNPLLLFHSQTTSHAALIRKTVFDSIGLYDPGFEIYGDREFMLRFSVQGFKARKIPEIVGLYFKNPKGLEFCGQDSGEGEFQRVLDRFLLPEYFVRLFGRQEIPGHRDLAQLYARAGENGKEYFIVDNQPVSNFGTAGVLFSKALEFDKSNINSLNNLAIIACISEDPNNGIKLFEKALENSGPDKSADIRWNINMAQKDSSKVDDYKWFNTLVGKNHKQKEIAMNSPQQMYPDIQTHISTGKYREAIAELQKFLQIYPDNALAHKDLGVLFYQEGDKEKSLTHYEQASDLQPENITFQKNLADFYHVELGRIEDALRIYVRVLESAPEDVETLLITGHICVALKQFDDAKDFYQRVLEIQPWNADAGRNLDKLREILNQQDVPRSIEEMYQAAQSVANEGRNGEAIQRLEKLLESFPDFAVAHNDLGVLYYKTGNKAQACEHYEKSAQLEPTNIISQKNLADFYSAEMAEFEKAMQIYIRVLENFPEDIESLMAIGFICEAMYKPEDADVFYSKVLQIEPWNLEAKKKLDRLNVTRKAI
jgi:tetratricopeptide (TPR) repeat protein